LQVKKRIAHSISSTTTSAQNDDNDFPTAEDIRLYTNTRGDRELTDEASISDHDLDSETIVYMVYRQSGGEDDWEDIQVDELMARD
jgi:hypothetical protein